MSSGAAPDLPLRAVIDSCWRTSTVQGTGGVARRNIVCDSALIGSVMGFRTKGTTLIRTSS